MAIIKAKGLCKETMEKIMTVCEYYIAVFKRVLFAYKTYENTELSKFSAQLVWLNKLLYNPPIIEKKK